MVLLLPYLEEANLQSAFELDKTFYVQPPETAQHQVGGYYCPSKNRTVKLSTTQNSRGSYAQPLGGALADYAMNAGDGALDPWFGIGKAFRGNGAAARTSSSGALGGSDPEWSYVSWKPMLSFKRVTDGLTKTLLIGEKFVHPERHGEASYGDWTWWGDDNMIGRVRVAGPNYPLASDDEQGVLNRPFNMRFGGPHSSICIFVFCDGSVHNISTSIDELTIGYLANRLDGEVIQNID